MRPPDAKAIAQAAALNEAARSLKRAASATRDALHTVRQVQAELHNIEVETIVPKPKEAQDGSTENSGTSL
jgi:hypothetical protein